MFTYFISYFIDQSTFAIVRCCSLNFSSRSIGTNEWDFSLLFHFIFFFFFPVNWVTVCMDFIIHYVNAFVIQPKDNFIKKNNNFSFRINVGCELVCVIICWLAHLGRAMRPNWYSECTEYAHRSLLTTHWKIKNKFFVKHYQQPQQTDSQNPTLNILDR